MKRQGHSIHSHYQPRTIQGWLETWTEPHDGTPQLAHGTTPATPGPGAQIQRAAWETTVVTNTRVVY